ncbi:arf-GAP with coiled-coil, ANK repeat and PH domain-containing protein 2-like isoform X2 [Cryptotermes secundus]|uniref:arf-GAP with coiled-coil, ANK repeat and PH domain-containing protein 2-like isoform X2 n=1 Tax=Cryptotermes secundus TaxID=105785 RepID=UPI000CD7BAB1|nr:arf-GAP with coiled-coil, ANK repeat and PH domain-containing protein 2-like isoform X2 [Cryptotermes secundus]
MDYLSQFTNSLWDLSSYFRDVADVVVCLNKLIHALQEMNKFHSIYLDQASRTILKNLMSFIKGVIKGVRESHHYFEKISVDLDGALSRNSQAPRSRHTEAEEAQNLLCATRSCFRHTALDHVYCLSALQAKKKPEVLGTAIPSSWICS